MALIELIASIRGDDTALVHPESDLRLTYGALRQRIQALAGALADAGVRRGDRIAVALPNSPALVVATLAAATVGVAVPANVESGGRSLVAATLIPGDMPDAVRVSVPNAVPERVTDSVPDDVAVVLETRGTTGPPKRVPLSHENLSLAARHVADRLALGPGDVTLCVMSIAHVLAGRSNRASAARSR